jgi:hypothetical protein
MVCPNPTKIKATKPPKAPNPYFCAGPFLSAVVLLVLVVVSRVNGPHAWSYLLLSLVVLVGAADGFVLGAAEEGLAAVQNWGVACYCCWGEGQVVRGNESWMDGWMDGCLDHHRYVGK